MKFTPRQLEAAVSLRGNNDFKILMEAVADHCSDMNERYIAAPKGDEYVRGQLRAHSAFLVAINSAATELDRARKPKT